MHIMLYVSQSWYDKAQNILAQSGRPRKPYKSGSGHHEHGALSFWCLECWSCLARCSQSLFALQGQQDLPADALQVVFLATVINKPSYARSAWWGFSSADDRNRLKAVLRDQLNSAQLFRTCETHFIFGEKCAKVLCERSYIVNVHCTVLMVQSTGPRVNSLGVSSVRVRAYG